MKKTIFLFSLIGMLCWSVFAVRDVTNNNVNVYYGGSTAAVTFIRTGLRAELFPNLFNSSGVVDEVVLYVEGAYVFSNNGARVTVPAKSTKTYNLLTLLNHDTNVWTNVCEKLFYIPTP